MSLVGQWRAIQGELPAGWADARLVLTVEDAAHCDRAAALLGPAQPYRAEPRVLRFSASTRGASTGPEAVRRLLARLDSERIAGTLELVSAEAAAVAEPAAEATLVESWQAALASIPPDWSDLHVEIEFVSSDYIDKAAVLAIPLNPRRDGTRRALRFRCARVAGYGASPGMVTRCLERCDAERIRGTVHVLRALSDTDNVGTQGPVWQVAGRTV